MTTFSKIYQINRFSEIVKKEYRYTPKEIANLLEMSESSFYELVKLCKDLGMEIRYNRTSMRYESINNRFINITW